MLNDNAKLWVAALRSGRFKQGRGCLTKLVDGGQLDCCLGVACKVAIENGLAVEVKPATFDVLMYEGETGILPESVASWLGLEKCNGVFGKVPSDFQQLTEMNDNGKTFAEIADIIESEPEGLFVTPRPE